MSDHGLPLMSLPEIKVSGTRLVTADGQGFPYVGVSAFPWFARYLMDDGWPALVKPLADDVRAAARTGGWGDRPIVSRVFRYAAHWNAFRLDPWSYMDSDGHFPKMTEFASRLADEGFYIDWTCGDAQEVLPQADGPRGQQQHQNETCAALAGTPGFIQRCNERFKNGVADGISVPTWGPYLTCSGDYGERHQWPWAVFDLWDYHGTRNSGGLTVWPKWLVDMNDQAAVLLDLIGKPGRLGEPRRLDELPGEANRPELWFNMGGTVAYCGVTLHSQHGRDGQLMGPVTRAGAEAFFAGAAGAVRPA